jgi:hypothetical protein
MKPKALVLCQCGNTTQLFPTHSVIGDWACSNCHTHLDQGYLFIPAFESAFTPEDIELLKGMRIEVAG